MSTPTDMADLIRNRILTAPAVGELATLVNLTGIPVIVYRQQDLDASVKAAVGKTEGCAIIVEWSGFQAADDDAGEPYLRQTYTVSVWSKPIIDAGSRPAALVLQSIIARLWNWVPVGSHSADRAKPRNGGITPSKNFLIYDCEVEIPTYL